MIRSLSCSPPLLLVALLSMAGCSGPEPQGSGPPDMRSAPPEDMARAVDLRPDQRPPARLDLGAPEMSATDMRALDTPTDARDAGADMRAGAPPLGELRGECGVLDEELTDEQSVLFRNVIDFGQDPYDPGERGRLSPGAREILDKGNAGGSSLLSEVFAYEVLWRCEGATLQKTETEVLYIDPVTGEETTMPMGSITDLVVEIDGERLGVSVVRALAFPFEDPYPRAEADRILRDKLEGIHESSRLVAPQDAWTKQILSVIAYTPQHADQIQASYMEMSEELRADTILYVTASEGDDGFLYFDER